MTNKATQSRATDEVLVIGAGPYGLSISAHLHALGISHQIVGRPNGTYRWQVPVGMNLKSEPYASDMAAPRPGYDVAAYCAQHGLDYSERLGPLSLERFNGYADWYIGQLVPNIRDITVSDVTRIGDGFRVSFADADPVTVRQVVVATGVLPYFRIPDELAGLRADLLSHTRDIHRLERFRGRRVAVIGAGQSALETAALLHEAGADTRLVVRGPTLTWVDPNPETISRLGRVRRPVNKLCEGWRCAVWFSPEAFRLLPARVRVAKARTVLGPSGSWWLKDRIEGVVETLLGHQLRGAEEAGSGVRLHLAGPAATTLDVDHVVAGTGFRVDVDRLTFLSATLRSQVTTLNKYPVLSRAGQSSVPGLWFAGAPAAVSLGPSERFIGGTHNSVAPLTRALAARARRRQGVAYVTGNGDDGPSSRSLPTISA
ncbi:MAG: NAD(P)-binding domain-containing protein [Actinobacteria bacterium]|nr:NAD(P)-binding domain-containing protein [Actinomycetota bacterium]